MNLFKEFKESSQEEWEEKIIQDLKGKPFETVFWDAEIGTVNPVLFDTKIKQSNPGEFPYTRSNKIGNNSWSIRQQFDCAEENSNAKILEALAGGVNAIELFHLGVDTDFATLLENIQIDILEIYLHVDSRYGIKIIESFKTYLTQKGYNNEAIRGGIIFDPIAELASTGRIKFNEDLVAVLIQFRKEYTNLTTFGVSAVTYAEAGANITTQIACALSHGHEYIVQCLESGEQLKDVVNGIEFSFSMGTSYFLEIAKIRAFRTLWATIINEYDESLTDFEIKIHAQTSNLYYSLKDKYNNLLRATTSGMSAVLAGVNSLTVLPFDVNEQVDSTSFGLRIAKNIQLLMQEEAYLNQVIDPAGGSYYIEELTQKIEEKAWEEFKTIEEKGGIMQALIQEEIQPIIKKQLAQKIAQLKDGSKIMVGVNKFENKEDKLGKPKEHLLAGKTVVEPLIAQRLAQVFENESIKIVE